MKINTKLVVMGTAVLWIALALGLIASKQQIIRTGQRILLETVPVDPRDLLRGDYVTLDYKICQIDLNKIPADQKQYNSGERIYVALQPQGAYWEPSGISKQFLKNNSSAQVFIRGKVEFCYKEKMRVGYGIESFFIPEGAGKPIEEKMRWRAVNREAATPVSVEVIVGQDGTAILSRLFLDQKEIRF
jgi:uncharacterized membrane-anchored protein